MISYKKQVVFAALITGFSFSAMSKDIKDSGMSKIPDTREYSVSGATRAATVSSSIAASPTFSRVGGAGPSVGACGNPGFSPLVGLAESVGYEVFTIVSPSGQNLDVSITLGTLSDSYISLYCSPFDPLNPNTNHVVEDDDGGAFLASAIPASDGVALSAGVPYDLVVTTYANGDVGSFTLNLGGDIVLYTPPPTSVPTMSAYGLAVLAGLLGFIGYRRRLK